jgi:hypothetical protein
MEHHAQISGNQNIVIQGVSESTITVNVNGEVQYIRNQLEELKTLMQNAHISFFRSGDKLYHIADLDEDNFPIATSKRLFNSTLVKGLLELIQDKPNIQEWLSGLPAETRGNWDIEPTHLGQAQSYLLENYIWVLAWELRRLFAVGSEAKTPELKIEEYMQICFSCYRNAMQVANYLLISTLWDLKKKQQELQTNIPEIQGFFGVAKLTSTQLRRLFSALIQLFHRNNIQLPLLELEVGKEAFIDPASAFNKAGEKLEHLMAMQGVPYRLGHCHTAEYNLVQVLKPFSFFTSHKLVTIKRVEYEALRHSTPRYIKDFNVLEKKEVSKNLQGFLKKDNNPTYSYALFFQSNQLAINLFPFVLDYNALINEPDFEIYLYQNRIGNTGLSYYTINQAAEKMLSFTNLSPTFIEVKSGEQKREIEKNIRVDLAIRQFEDAMNTLLGTDISFTKAPGMDQFDNI